MGPDFEASVFILFLGFAEKILKQVENNIL